jgi:hypothetical protein
VRLPLRTIKNQNKQHFNIRYRKALLTTAITLFIVGLLAAVGITTVSYFNKNQDGTGGLRPLSYTTSTTKSSRISLFLSRTSEIQCKQSQVKVKVNENSKTVHVCKPISRNIFAYF